MNAYMESLLLLVGKAFVLGYVCGSIPFGPLLTRAAGLGDVRAIGSGNIGATNVLRTGRKGLAALTLLLDALKAVAAVLITQAYISDELGVVAALGAFLGHLFPLWLKFKGGKGVATFLGGLGALVPLVAVVFCAVWLGVALITRYSSLAAMLAAASAVAALYVGDGLTVTTALIAGMAVILILKHHANIGRLLRGQESRIGAAG